MDGVGRSGPGACHFFRRPSTKRTYSAMSDSHRSTSPDSLFVSQDDHHYNNQQSASRSRLALPPRPERFVGDGLDFRRPVVTSGAGAGTDGMASGSRAMVIDLTDEDDSHVVASDTQTSAEPAPVVESPHARRLPRYERNIIEVESEDEAESHGARRTANSITFDRPLTSHGHNDPHDTSHPQYSVLRRPQHQTNDFHQSLNMDEVEFVEQRARPRPRTRPRSHTPATLAHRSVTPYLAGDPIDLTNDDDDDVVLVDMRARPGGVNFDRPDATGGAGVRSVADRLADHIGGMFQARLPNGLLERFADLDRVRGALGQTEQTRNARTHTHNHRDNRTPAANPLPWNGMLVAMDYTAPGWNMGFAGGNAPQAPKYEPPEAAASGFTRSPGEDEVVVCPNCGDELALGSTDEKQEVWIIKKCGHAYCGDCARNRAKASRATKKGKGKAAVTLDAPTFNKCVVDKCNESASSKSMVHVYLGS